MLNKQQREFRKQMKKVEKKKRRQGIEDPYSYRYESERPKKEKRSHPFIWLLILLALYGLVNVIGNWSANQDTRQPLVVESWDTSEEQVHHYLSDTETINQRLIEIWNRFSTYEYIENVTTEELQGLQQEVMALQDTVKTDKDEFQELEVYYLEQIMLTNNMLQVFKDSKSDGSVFDALKINDLRNQFNKRFSEHSLFVIRILEGQGLPFELKEDGSIYYEYKQSVLEDK